MLKLIFAAMIRASERWRAIKIIDFERRQMTALRAELDHEYETETGLKPTTSKETAKTKLSSNNRA